MIRKNKKFIDPRYFMNEKMESLDEAKEAPPYRTGVPEEDVLAHALDLEKYPTTPQEEVSDIIAAALEKAYEHLGGKQVEMIDDQLLDKAMELRDWIETLV